MTTTNPAAQDAADLARRADEVSAKLKAGTWDSVQALALVSIAKSLSVLAAAATSDPGTRR